MFGSPHQEKRETNVCMTFLRYKNKLLCNNRQLQLFLLILCNSRNYARLKLRAGADPEVFERGGPEAIIYKNLERGGPKSFKMAFECSFLSFSYKSFANIPPKGGPGPPGPLP